MGGTVYTVGQFVRQMNDFNPTDKIWRYMSFTKFISLLFEQALYFARSDTFNDKREGLPPLTNSQRAMAELSKSPDHILSAHSQAIEDDLAWLRERTFISCWNISDDESYTMWQSYGSQEQGVAIQTTVERLNEEIETTNSDLPLSGKVQYLDHRFDEMPSKLKVLYFFQKRTYFAAEQEFRVVLFDPKSERYRRQKYGVYSPVNILELIERVYVPPLANDWYVRTVNGVLKQFNFEHIPVCRSGI